MDVKATTTIRVICAVLIIFPTLIGLVFNSIVFAAFYKGWKKFRSNCFYLVMVQIIGCNICSLFLYLYIAFPITLTGVQYMGDSGMFYHAPLFLDGVAYTGMIFLTFLVAVNRLTVFVFPKINDRVFSKKNTLIMSAALWIYILFIATIIQLLGCPKLFSVEEFYFFYDCSNLTSSVRHYVDFLLYQTYVMVTLMGLINIIVYIKIRTSQQNLVYGVRRGEREKSFLFQTIPLSVLFSIEAIMFYFIPILHVTGYHRFIVVTLENLVVIATFAISPVLMLIFNGDVRKFACNVFQKSRSVSIGE